MASTNKVSLKLLIDRKEDRVLFAEAGKDFVDFLFHIFSLPLGAVSSLLTKEQMVGCLGKLYGSIEELDTTYLQPCVNKDDLFNPKTPSYSSNAPLFLTNKSASETLKKLYCCRQVISSSCFRVTDDPNTLCKSCYCEQNQELKYVPSTRVTVVEGCGYVKGVVPYMIMDDLQVKPILSPISSVTLLNTFNVRDLGMLEEKVVDLSVTELRVQGVETAESIHAIRDSSYFLLMFFS